MKYISPSGLEELKNYKYHGIDHSLLANYVMQPFWRKAVYLLPIWIAPNLVTLLGFFGILASYFIMAFYCPSISEIAPPWVYLFCAICIFWYQTMDALDGKQARRTGSSSPLGELFDHGCDAMSTAFIGLTYACTMRVGNGWFLFILIVGSYAVFFMAQWEEYQTGVMELGYMNVTEIQLFICGFYLATYIWGTDFWTSTVSIFGYETTLNMIPAVIILVGTNVTIIGNIISVLKHKGVNLFEAFKQLIPIIILVIGSFFWAYLSPNNIAERYPHNFYLIIGFIFSYITGRIVTNRVCREKFDSFHPVELFFLIAIGYCLFNGQNYFDEFYLAIFGLVLAILQYLHFASSVIQQMTTHLNIKCFKIPVKKND